MEEFVAAAWPYAMAVLVILGAVALVFLVIVLYRVAATMKSVQSMAAEAEKEVTPALAKVNPMVDKAELMLDTVNLEMLRVDSILEDVEQITDVAGKAATTVDTVTSAPAEVVTSLVDRIRGSIGTKRSNKQKQENLVFPVGEHDAEPTGDAEESAGSTSDEQLKQEAKRIADSHIDIDIKPKSDAAKPEDAPEAPDDEKSNE